MMRYLKEIEITDHDAVLYEMGMKEKEHEVYFQKCLANNRLLPLFQKNFGWGQQKQFQRCRFGKQISHPGVKGIL